jgi:putative membrane protein insertion efficiency factor
MKPKETSLSIMVSKIYSIVKKSLIKILILPIRFYQLAISPYLQPSCRHIPTCSNYAIEALKTHGIFIGLYYATRRILRCHPWGTHGYDPVPPSGKRIEP